VIFQPAQGSFLPSREVKRSQEEEEEEGRNGEGPIDLNRNGDIKKSFAWKDPSFVKEKFRIQISRVSKLVGEILYSARRARAAEITRVAAN
jgi:hypothetical protein